MRLGEHNLNIAQGKLVMKLALSWKMATWMGRQIPVGASTFALYQRQEPKCGKTHFCNGKEY
jgi:hypothetical protein